MGGLQRLSFILPVLTAFRCLQALTILSRCFLNRPVRDDVFLTVEFEDHTKLRYFPEFVSIPFTGMAVFYSAEVAGKSNVNSFCWPKYTHPGMRKDYIDHEKRCFEWSSNWTVRKTSPRNGWLRKRLLVGTDFRSHRSIAVAKMYRRSYRKSSAKYLI